MRILDFIVDKQCISKSPACDFSGLVGGTTGYLTARFKFSSEWNGYKRAAIFKYNGSNYPVALKNNMCEIPPEVTEGSFKVTVGGIDKDGRKLTCDWVTVIQRRFV